MAHHPIPLIILHVDDDSRVPGKEGGLNVGVLGEIINKSTVLGEIYVASIKVSLSH